MRRCAELLTAQAEARKLLATAATNVADRASRSQRRKDQVLAAELRVMARRMREDAELMTDEARHKTCMADKMPGEFAYA
jgi:hypothetical protein